MTSVSTVSRPERPGEVADELFYRRLVVMLEGLH
jgi:hypothetical protein